MSSSSDYSGQKHSNRKATSLNPDEVVDDQGRRRFHGAFTGGFSAGYFNTVGSAEGFKPVEFMSSRGNRASSKQRSAFDYMDTEDGLLGKKLSTNEAFDTLDENVSRSTTELAKAMSHGSSIPGPVPKEFIMPASTSIGKKLLQKMGWKEGQGVGPRTRLAEGKIDIHPGASWEMLPNASLVDGVVSFAPVNTIDEARMPAPKNDLKGVGFDSSAEDPEFYKHLKNLNGDSNSSLASKRYKISDVTDGKAVAPSYSGGSVRFQGYAYDSDDDDGVYDTSVPVSASKTAVDLLSSDEEDLTGFGGKNKRKVISTNIDNWLNGGSSSILSSSSKAVTGRCQSDGRPPLPGFVIADVGVEPPAPYYPPEPPIEGFTGIHIFDDSPVVNAVDKRIALVDNIVEKETVDVVAAALAAAAERRTAILKRDEEKKSAEPAKPIERPMLTSDALLKSTFAGLSAAFKNRFAAASTSTSSSISLPSGLILSADLPKPKDEEPKIPQQNTSTPRHRVIEVWSPHPLLCKRMNIPLPSSSLSENERIRAVREAHRNGESLPKGPTIQSSEEAIMERAGLTMSAVKNVVASHTDANTTDDANAFSAELPVEIPVRPPIDLFKSIFDDSSSSESDSEEDEKDNSIGDVLSMIVTQPASGAEPMALVLGDSESMKLPAKIVFQSSKVREKGATTETSSSISKNKAKVALSFQDDVDDMGEGLSIVPVRKLIPKDMRYSPEQHPLPAVTAAVAPSSISLSVDKLEMSIEQYESDKSSSSESSSSSSSVDQVSKKNSRKKEKSKKKSSGGKKHSKKEKKSKKKKSKHSH